MEIHFQKKAQIRSTHKIPNQHTHPVLIIIGRYTFLCNGYYILPIIYDLCKLN